MEFVASKQVQIVNPNGLHARPAYLFARMASRFTSRVEIVKDDQRVDGKSILEILMLAATCGTTLTIEASGSDDREAVEALARLLEQGDPLDKSD